MKSRAYQTTPTPVLDLLPSLLTTKTNRPRIDQALALAKRQLDERNVEMSQLRSELAVAHAGLARARESQAGVVQERDADRHAFAEQQRAHANERQRIEERAAATERRLLEDIDRSRQDAKAARNAQADGQRQQELLRVEVQKLSERNHQAQVEIAALTERLAASRQRESGMSQALQELRAATSQPAVTASKVGRKAGIRKSKA